MYGSIEARCVSQSPLQLDSAKAKKMVTISMYDDRNCAGGANAAEQYSQNKLARC